MKLSQPGFIISIYQFLRYRLLWWRAKTNEETTIERPSFSTNIFDEPCECEEEEVQPQDDDTKVVQNQMFWLCVVIVLFFGGVAISYYIIH